VKSMAIQYSHDGDGDGKTGGVDESRDKLLDSRWECCG
jgi:hypothetical protein